MRKVWNSTVHIVHVNKIWKSSSDVAKQKKKQPKDEIKQTATDF